MSNANSHESFKARDEVKVGSDRGFGIVFAVVFAIVGLLPLIGGAGPRLWALAVAAVFLAAALVIPKVLRPLNLLWFRFGMLLHHVMTPLVMGAIFLLTVVPTALVFRMLGKDPLRLRRDPEAASYWLHRDPPGPDPKTMTNQF